MHAREHPSIIHAAVFVHNSIGGYALGGWKSRYSRQTESSEDTPDSRHPKKKLDAKETEGCGKYRSQTKFADLSQYVRSPLPLSLSLSYTTKTTGHNYLEIWAKIMAPYVFIKLTSS
jgi:hypothetical protein